MIIGVQKFSIFFYGYEADRPVFWAGRADGWQLNLQVCLTIVVNKCVDLALLDYRELQKL